MPGLAAEEDLEGPMMDQVMQVPLRAFRIASNSIPCETKLSPIIKTPSVI